MMLFRMVIEYEATRDAVTIDHDAEGPEIGWTNRAVPPPGEGWVLIDGSSKKRSKWRRIRLAPCTQGAAL